MEKKKSKKENEQFIFRTSKTKDIDNAFISIVDERTILLVRNFSDIFHKFNSALLSEAIVINLEANKVIEHVMFNRKLSSDILPIYREIEEKEKKIIVQEGHTSDIIRLTEQVRIKLPEYYASDNIVSVNNYKSVRGEKIKFSVFDQNKWSNKAKTCFGVPKKISNK